jgi:hypothetical protein
VISTAPWCGRNVLLSNLSKASLAFPAQHSSCRIVHAPIFLCSLTSIPTHQAQNCGALHSGIELMFFFSINFCFENSLHRLLINHGLRVISRWWKFLSSVVGEEILH